MTLVAPLLSMTGLIACVGTASATHPHPEEEAQTSKKTETRWEWKVSDDDKDNTIIVERDGKDANVVIDGKTIEGTVKVEQKDGHLIIMDGDGKVLRKIELPELPGNFAFRFGEDGDLRFGDGGAWNFRTNQDFDKAFNVKVREGRPIIGVELTEGDGHYVIHRVLEDGPAAKAGIKADDVLIRIGEHEAHNLDEIREVLGKHKAGDDVKVFVLRGGDEKSFQVKLAPAEGEAFFSEDGGNYRVFFDEDRARAMKEKAAIYQKRAEEQAREHFFTQRFSDDAEENRRIAIELKEKLRSLEPEQRREIELHMRRAEEALQGLEGLELDFEMPEMEIFELDGKNNRVVVVPAPKAPKAPRVRVERAPEPPKAHFEGQWGEGDSRLERLEERVDRIEALIEKILHKLEERNS
jgi:hypothetical protein